jgi:hypothetical protein
MKRNPGYLLAQLPSREILDDAACAPVIAPLFDPLVRADSDDPEAGSIVDSRRRQSIAMLVCGDCPVSQLCFEYGVRNKLTGVYGGVSMTGRFHRTTRKAS